MVVNCLVRSLHGIIIARTSNIHARHLLAASPSIIELPLELGSSFLGAQQNVVFCLNNCSSNSFCQNKKVLHLTNWIQVNCKFSNAMEKYYFSSCLAVWSVVNLNVRLLCAVAGPFVLVREMNYSIPSSLFVCSFVLCCVGNLWSERAQRTRIKWDPGNKFQVCFHPFLCLDLIINRKQNFIVRKLIWAQLGVATKKEWSVHYDWLITLVISLTPAL